jgi:hypothetical protein
MAATARLHLADLLLSLCADEAALPKRHHNNIVFETQTQTVTLALRSLFKDTPHICLQPLHRTEQDSLYQFDSVEKSEKIIFYIFMMITSGSPLIFLEILSRFLQNDQNPILLNK